MKHIIDIRWKNNDQNHYFFEMVLYDSVTQNREKIPLRNIELNLHLSHERRCVGTYIKGEYQPCDNNALLFKESQTECFACEQKLGFKSAFLFGKAPNDLMKEHLATNHFIYLAYFASGNIKVGTAAESRKYLRLLEQDALVGMHIAQKSGFEISEFEHAISKQLGITEFVRGSAKRKSLSNRIHVDEARAKLLQTYQKILHHFKITKFSNWLLDEDSAEFISFTDLPQMYYPSEDIFTLKYEDSQILFGTIVGLRGKFLITKYKEQEFLYKIDSIIGREIIGYQVSEDLVQKILTKVPREEQLGFGF